MRSARLRFLIRVVLMLVRLAAVATALVLSLPAGYADAADFYGGLGLPGMTAGVAQSLNPSVTLRADLAALPGFSMERTENGIRYDGETTVRRLGLFADWFVLGNGFRLTGGLTVNQIHLDLEGKPDGGTIMIGEQTYPVGASDRFNARVEFPRVTPYVGIGWGHQQGDTGWGVHADLGVSIGRASVTAQASGELASQPGVQEAIEQEIVELRDGAGRVRVIPQVSVGVSYRF